MMSHAEPCPFCRAKAYESSKGVGGPGNEHTWKYRLCCHSCGSEGPTKPTLDEAYAAWNASHRESAERRVVESDAMSKRVFLTCVAGDGPTPYLKVHFNNLADAHAAHDQLLGIQENSDDK